MEIPAPLYFSFWSLISLTCLACGLKALDKANAYVSPTVVTFFFKRFLAVSVCLSSCLALVSNRHPDGQISRTEYYSITLALLYYPSCYQIYVRPYPFWPVFCLAVFVSTIIWWRMGFSRYGYATEFFVRAMMLGIGDGGNFAFSVLLITTITSEIARRYCDQIGGTPRLLWNAYNKKTTVRFAMAMLGSILFQRFVKFTSFLHELAFLFFAGAWIGCLALLMSPAADPGVFEFLLSNVLVGCTANEFGLHRSTWFAYLASVLLFFLRHKLQTVRYVQKEDIVLIGDPNHGSQIVLPT